MKKFLSMLTCICMLLSLFSGFGFTFTFAATPSVSDGYKPLFDESSDIYGNTMVVIPSLDTAAQTVSYLFSGVTVTEDYSASRHFASYADALAAWEAAHTETSAATAVPNFILTAGTYTETITVRYNANIYGAQAGITPNDPDFDTESALATEDWGANPVRDGSTNETVLSGKILRANTKDGSNTDTTYSQVMADAGVTSQTLNVDGVKLTHTTGIDVDDMWISEDKIITNYINVCNSIFSGNKHAGHGYYDGSRNGVNYYFEECLVTGLTGSMVRYNAQEIVLERVNMKNSKSVYFGSITENGNETVYNKVGGSKYLLYKAANSRFADCTDNAVFGINDNTYETSVKLVLENNIFKNANSGSYGVFRVDTEDSDGNTRYAVPEVTVKNNLIYSSTQKYTVFNGGSHNKGPMNITFNYNRVIGYNSPLPNSADATSLAGSRFNFDYNYIGTAADYTGVDDWNGQSVVWSTNYTGTTILDVALVPYYFDYAMTTSSDMLEITGAAFADSAKSFEINQGGRIITAIIPKGTVWDDLTFTTSVSGASVSVAKDGAAVTSISASDIGTLQSYDITVSFKGVTVAYKLAVYADADIQDFTALTPELPLKNTAALLTTEEYENGEAVVVTWQGALTRFVYGTNAFSTVAAARSAGFTQMVLSNGEYGSFEIDGSVELYGEDYATNPNKKYDDPMLPWDLADQWKESVTTVTGAVKLTSATAGATVKIMGIILGEGGYIDDDQRSTSAAKATLILENVYVVNATSTAYTFYTAQSQKDELIFRNSRFNNTKSRFMVNSIPAHVTVDGVFFCEGWVFFGYPQYTAAQTSTSYTIKNCFMYRYGGTTHWSYFQGHNTAANGAALDTHFTFNNNILIDCFDNRANDSASGGFSASLGGSGSALNLTVGAFKSIDIQDNTFVSTWDLFCTIIYAASTTQNPNTVDMSDKITFAGNRVVGMRSFIEINSYTGTLKGANNYYARYTDGYALGTNGQPMSIGCQGMDYYLDFAKTTLASEMEMVTERPFSMTNATTREASVIIGEDELYTSDLYTVGGDKYLLYEDAACENAVAHITASDVGEGRLFYAKATSEGGVSLIYKLYVTVGDASDAIEPTSAGDIENPYLYYLGAQDMPVGTRFVMTWDGTKYIFTAGVNAFANVSKLLTYHSQVSEGTPNVIMPAGVYNNQVTLTSSVNFYGEGADASATEMKPFSESKAIRIACVGDSITEGQGVSVADRATYSYPAQLQTKLNSLYGEGVYEVKNCGWGGSTINVQTNRETNSYTYWTYIYTAQYFQALDFNPDIVTIMMGHNDANLYFYTTKQQYKDQFRKIIDTFEALPSKPTVVVAGSPGTLTSGVRAGIFAGEVIPAQKELAEENGTIYIDTYTDTIGKNDDKTLFTDGIHMTAKGYDMLSDILLEGLTPILADERTAVYNNITTNDTLTLSESDKIKVACIGDSFTYGDKEYAGYPVYLQQYLGTAGYEVRSYGEDGATLIDSKDGTLISESSNPWCYDNTSRGKASFEWDPDIVIITLGTNDLGGHMTSYHNLSWTLDADGNTVSWLDESSTAAQEYKRDYARLIAQYRSQGAQRIIISSNPRNGYLIDILEDIAAENDVEFINTYETTKSWDSSYSNGTNKNGVSDGHFSAKGYKAYGKLIAESLFPEFADWYCDTEGEIENTAFILDSQAGTKTAGDTVTYNWEGRAYTFTWGENAFSTVDEIIAKADSGKVQILIPENTVATTGAGFTVSALADVSNITAIEVYGQNRLFDPSDKSAMSNDPTADWPLSDKWDSYSENGGTSAVGKITVSTAKGFGTLKFKGITMRDSFYWTTRTSTAGNTDITFENVRVDNTSTASGFIINNNSSWTSSGAISETMTLKNVRIDDYRKASGRLWSSNNSNNLVMDGVYFAKTEGYSNSMAYYQSSNNADTALIKIIGCNFRNVSTPTSIAPAQGERKVNTTVTVKNNVFYNTSGITPVYPYFVNDVTYEGNYFILPNQSSAMTFGIKFSSAITSGNLQDVMSYRVINNNFVVGATSAVSGATINAQTPVDMTGNYVAVYTDDYLTAAKGVSPDFNMSEYDYYYLDFARTVKNTDIYLKELGMASVVKNLVIGESSVTGEVEEGMKITDLSAVAGSDKASVRFYSDATCTAEVTSLEYDSAAKTYYIKVSYGELSKVYPVSFSVGEAKVFKTDFVDADGIIGSDAIALIPTATSGEVLAQWQGNMYKFTVGENAFASWEDIKEVYGGKRVQIIMPAGTYSSYMLVNGPWEIYGEGYKTDPNIRADTDVTLNPQWSSFGETVLTSDIYIQEGAIPIDSDVDILISGIRMSRYYNSADLLENGYRTVIVLRNIVYDRVENFKYQEFNITTGNPEKDEFRIENMHFINTTYRNTHPLFYSTGINTVVIDGFCIPGNATSLGNFVLTGDGASFTMKNCFMKGITDATSVYPYIVSICAENGRSAVFENNTFIDCAGEDSENGSNSLITIDQSAFESVAIKDNTAVCTKDGDHKFISWTAESAADYTDKISFTGNRLIGLMPAVTVNDETDIDLSYNYFAKYTGDYAEVANGDIPADTDANYYLDFAKTVTKEDMLPEGIDHILATDTLYTYATEGSYTFELKGVNYEVFSDADCNNKITGVNVAVGEADRVYVKATKDNASVVYTMYVMGVKALADVQNAKEYVGSVYYPTLYGAANGIPVISYSYGTPYAFTTGESVVTTDGQLTFSDSGVLIPDNITSAELTVTGYVKLAGQYADNVTVTSRQMKIGAVGDSITYGAQATNVSTDAYPVILETYLGSDYDVGNFGHAGATVQLLANGAERQYQIYGKAKYDASIAYAPDVIIIGLGTNDLDTSRWKSNREYVEQYIDLIDDYMSLDTKPMVFVTTAMKRTDDGTGVKQMRTVENLIPLQKLVADAVGGKVIDTYTAMLPYFNSTYIADNLHPNTAGYKILGEYIGSELTALMNEETDPDPAPEQHFSWSYDAGSGALTVSGVGAMPDFEPRTAPWIEAGYQNNIYSVVVEEGITEIGDWAFSYLYYARTVNLPESLESIGTNAFYQCMNLEEAIIPENVGTIGGGAFAYCKKLASVSVPVKVTAIESYTFYDCEKLEKVYYNASEAQWNALTKKSNNDALSDVALYDETLAGTTWSFDETTGTLTIGGYARMENYNAKETPWYDYANDIKKIVVEEGVTGLGNWAFSYCFYVTEIVLPETLVHIGSGAFYNCSSLTDIELPGGLTRLFSGAFYNCKKLASITIPVGIDTVYANTFLGCSSLAEVSFNGTKVQWEKVNVLSNNTELTDLEMNCLVKSIEWTLSEDGTLTVSGGVPMDDYELKTAPMAPWADVKTDIKKVVIEDGITNIGNNAFYGCTNLTEVVIPDSVTSIGYGAFWACYGLESIVIPEGVDYIGVAAFYACSALKEITIPSTVTSILAHTFYNCVSLSAVNYGGDIANLNITETNNNYFISAIQGM